MMWYLSFFLFFVCATLAKSDGQRENELYIIKSVPSGLVLDASDSNRVTMQFYTGFKPQLWRFVRGRRAGLYQIVSNQTGSVLDYRQSNSKNYLVTNPPSGTLRQEWFVHANRRIVNAESLMNMDVEDASTSAGTSVIVFRDNGAKNQEFTLQMKEGDYNKDSSENGQNNNEGSNENSNEKYINNIVKDTFQ